MTVQRKIEILVAIVVVAVGLLVLHVFLVQHDANLQAAADAKAQTAIIASKAADIKSRDDAATAQAAALTSAAAKIQTVPQATKVILQYLPAPAPVAGAATTPPATLPTITRDELTPAAQAALPDAPPASTYTLFTAAQLTAQARKDLACSANQTLLTACQADRSDEADQLAAAQKEAATWKAAAKGGTKLQRLVKVVKYVACAGAGAAAGQYIDKQSPAAGAAIGSAAAVSTCAIF